MKDRSIILTILACLLIVLTTANVGLYATNRMMTRTYEARLEQINQKIADRDKRVQQFIGQLKATKTIEEVKDLLDEVQ